MRNRLRNLVFLSMLGAGLTACEVETPDYQPDNTDPTNNNAGATCKPVLSGLTFTGGVSKRSLPLIRASMTYELKCDATLYGSTLRLKLSNVDALTEAEEEGLPEPSGAIAMYDYLIVDPEEGEEVWVVVDEDAETLTLDSELVDSTLTTTTFGFEFRLVDTNGRTSAALSEEVVYQDLPTE